MTDLMERVRAAERAIPLDRGRPSWRPSQADARPARTAA